MKRARLIARLDIKGSSLIKGMHLEGLRKLGDPQQFAERYYAAGIDEIIYMDIVASLYGRDSLRDIVQRTAERVFIPMTVGGGLRSVEDVQAMLRAGADKVAINTAAIKRPELISEVARKFGSQAMVLSVEAKRQPDGSWEAYVDSGRERTGREVLAWIKQAVALGAGEVLLTSVDQEGTQRGLDLELIKKVSAAVSVPVIASGGVGSIQHVLEGIESGHADAVAIAHMLHYGKLDLKALRDTLQRAEISVRAA